MMLNSRFELSKIEKNTRVEREICLATLENREWKENLFLPLSKIESRKRIVPCHSRKSRVEREMGTIKFSRSKEKFLFLLSIFLSRARLLSMPAQQHRLVSSTKQQRPVSWMKGWGTKGSDGMHWHQWSNDECSVPVLLGKIPAVCCLCQKNWINGESWQQGLGNCWTNQQRPTRQTRGSVRCWGWPRCLAWRGTRRRAWRRRVHRRIGWGTDRLCPRLGRREIHAVCGGERANGTWSISCTDDHLSDSLIHLPKLEIVGMARYGNVAM